LSHEQGALAQVWEPVLEVSLKVVEDILVSSKLEVLATDLDGDDLLVGEGRRKAAAPDWETSFERLEVVTDQKVHADDKILSIHWVPPLEQLDLVVSYSSEATLNGSTIKSRTLGSICILAR
jgi:hypothetical protein